MTPPHTTLAGGDTGALRAECEAARRRRRRALFGEGRGPVMSRERAGEREREDRGGEREKKERRI